jgi:hypothetical protein
MRPGDSVLHFERVLRPWQQGLLAGKPTGPFETRVLELLDAARHLDLAVKVAKVRQRPQGNTAIPPLLGPPARA